jgi:hypothetical protein
MAKHEVSFDTVRRIGLALPGVEESSAYGMPALKIRKQLLATLPSHSSAEPDSLVVRINLEDRAELLATDPAVYYITDHYTGFDGVLVRLSRISPELLKSLLMMSHKHVTRKAGTIPKRQK